MHYPGHDYCGPGSQEHLEKHYPARNQLDQYCKEHDLSYKRGVKDYFTSQDSDLVLMRQAYDEGGLASSVVGTAMFLKYNLQHPMSFLSNVIKMNPVKRPRYMAKRSLGASKRRKMSAVRSPFWKPLPLVTTTKKQHYTGPARPVYPASVSFRRYKRKRSRYVAKRNRRRRRRW